MCRVNRILSYDDGGIWLAPRFRPLIENFSPHTHTLTYDRNGKSAYIIDSLKRMDLCKDVKSI